MLTTYLKTPRTLACYRSGPAGPHSEMFVRWLERRGYPPPTGHLSPVTRRPSLLVLGPQCWIPAAADPMPTPWRHMACSPRY